MAFQQLPGGLDLRNILKGILGDQKEAPGVKIQVKEVGRLFKSAEVLPIPSLTSFLGLQQDALVFQAEGKCILEGGGSFINAEGEQAPDRQP